MKNNLTLILLFIIIILLGLNYCSRVNPINNYETISSDTTLTYDTTIYHINNVNVKPQHITYKDTVIIDEAKIKELLNDYFAVYKYKDTLKNDTSATIILEENISQNKILTRDLMFVNNRPTKVIINNLKPTPHIISFFGGLSNIEKNNIVFGIGGGIKYDKHNLGVYINTNKSLTLNYNYYLK